MTPIDGISVASTNKHVSLQLAAGTQEALRINCLIGSYGLKLLIERHKAFSVRPGYVKKNIFCKFINFNNNFITEYWNYALEPGGVSIKFQTGE